MSAVSCGIPFGSAKRMTYNELRAFMRARSDSLEMAREPEKKGPRDATQADIARFARS